jgi:uncharacterized membrane protein
VYALFYFVLGAIRYAAHRNFVDLGIFAQTSASAFGCFCNTVEGSHWAYHFSPILYAAGALMRLWPSALALVALQAAAGALTIPPIYAIVARYTDRRAARLAAAVVFLYPPLAGAVFNDFHENGLAAAAVAWLLWAYDAGALLWTLAFAALALAIKEDQAIFLCVAGVLAFWRYRGTWPRGPLALAIACVSAAVAIKFFAVIQPHAAANAHWSPERFYDWTAGDVRALLPAGILQRIGFLLLAFVPLLLLPFRTRAFAIAILPLAEVLCSRMSTTFTMGSHYAGAWAGYVLFAFACALRPIYSRDPQRAYRILYWCIGLCVAEFATADPLHPRDLLRARTQADAALDAFLRTLPRNAPVATQEEAYTHLAATDPNATVLPETTGQPIRACMILTDDAFPNSVRLQESRPLVAQLVSARVYRVVRREGAITLYMRTAGCR